MPAFSTFTINDGSMTPVAVTYSPELISSGKVSLYDRRLDGRDKQPSLVHSWSPPTATRKTYRQDTRGSYPLVRTIGGTDVVVDTARGGVDFVIPESMTSQERKHLFAMIVNAASHALFKAGVVDLDPVRS